MARFDSIGIRPRTKLGQNFLIDLNLLRLLFESAAIGPNDVVLEVGAGTGGLTALLAAQARAVVAVELDRNLAQLAREQLREFNNVTLLELDALKNKNRLQPEMVAAVQEKLAESPGSRFKLVANLPYNVATPIISNLLLSEIVPHSMTVTIQKELAERITAVPGTKDYGALSVWIQSQCQATLVRVMPPTVFWPRPKVSSAIVHIELNERLRGRIPDLVFFHDFIRAMFFHRRKFLRSVVLSAFKGRLDKPEVDAVLDQLALDPTLRAEMLDVDRLLELCEALRARLPE